MGKTTIFLALLLTWTPHLALARKSEPVRYKILMIERHGGSFPLVKLNRIAYPKQMKALNEILKKINSSYGCEKISKADQKLETLNSEFHVTLKPTRVSRDMLSFKVDYDFNCPGTTHPETGTGGINLDLVNGKEIVFQQLFQDYKRDGAQIVNRIFGPEMLSTNPSCNNDAAQVAEKIERDEFYVSGGSLNVVLNAPYNHHACGLSGRVAASDLAQFAAPNGVLEELAKTFPRVSCEAQCKSMKSKGELKRGISLEQCQKLMCK